MWRALRRGRPTKINKVAERNPAAMLGGNSSRAPKTHTTTNSRRA
ncbi:hypothetical protein [Microlunatus soli]|nr:hypothetical protein [Microlunatus soli]